MTNMTDEVTLKQLIEEYNELQVRNVYERRGVGLQEKHVFVISPRVLPAPARRRRGSHSPA